MNAVCIKCWDTDAVVRMALDGTREFSCAECDETFTCDEVRDTLAALQKGWGPLLKWADAYPTDEPAAK